MHKTLEKVLIKWMKPISKTFKNDKFSEYDMKPARPSDNAKKPYRPSNNAKKPYTDKAKKPDTDKTKKPNTNKAKKPDADKDIKPDVRKYIKPHLKKMIDDIKRIFECVICEEFINEKFVPEYMFRDEFELISKYRKDTNESYSIAASRKNIIIQRCDVPACDVTKYKIYTIHIEPDRVTLEA